jgi:outer membrane protein assembly factor BamD (BamD/ComL family)
MLKPQKTRLNKKELKKDPLLDSVLKAQTFYEANKNNITYGIIAVIIAALLVIWVMALQDEEEQQAITLLGKAQVEYDNMNYTKARDFLNKLRETLEGTDAELQGTLLLANLDYNDENITEAKQLFSAFIDSYSGSEILLASAYAGVAACEEKENNFSAAAENYKKASTVSDGPQVEEYIYLAGINYINAGDTQQGREVLQKLIDEYPDSPKAYDAKTKLILASK